MLRTGQKRYLTNMLREFGVGSNSRAKFLLLLLGIIVLGFGFLAMKLSEVLELQHKMMSSCLSQNRMGQVPAHPNAIQTTSGKPKYWLQAKSADSPHMQHVRNAFRLLGYERWDGKTDSWDVMWAYEYPFPSKIKPENIKPNQLINHFPGLGYLTSKVFLAKSKSKYIPTAFALPKDKKRFEDFVKYHPETLWVQKSNNHRGITIKGVQELDLNAANTFVQEFVKDPFLIDNRKFDIGVYTIVTSVEPLRVYVYDGDWLIRFCPEDYLPLDTSNKRKYVVEDDYTPTWEITSLRDYYVRLKLSHQQTLIAHLRKNGHDADSLRQRLYDAVAEMTLEKQPDFIRSMAKYPYGSSSFFEMVRFDFVLDAKLDIFLMEVNMSPNLSSAHFSANALLYEQVMRNTLSLAGVTFRMLHTDESMHAGALVSEHDIQVLTEECAKCVSCDSEVCQLCNPCRSPQLTRDLKQAVMEHQYRLQSVRVFPKPHESPEAAGKSDFAPSESLGSKDRVLSLWYWGMCLKQELWCG